MSSLPTIFLSKTKKGLAEKPKPQVFEGKRTVKGITKWLQPRVTNRFMFTAGGKEQDVPDSVDLGGEGADATEPVNQGSEGSCSASAAKDGKCKDKEKGALDEDAPGGHEEL